MKHYQRKNRAKVFGVSMLALVGMFLGISIFTAGRAFMVMSSKVSETSLTNYQIMKLYFKLKDEGITDEQIKDFEKLRTNENGMTYGLDVLGADLIKATSDQGLDGYVYREDMYFYEYYMQEFQVPEDAIKWQEEWRKKYPDGYSVPVYESDGETQIGTFTM